MSLRMVEGCLGGVCEGGARRGAAPHAVKASRALGCIGCASSEGRRDDGDRSLRIGRKAVPRDPVRVAVVMGEAYIPSTQSCPFHAETA